MRCAKSLSRLLVSLMLVAVCFPILMQAQFRASLRGTVTDPQGAVVPGATVTLTNKDTGQIQTSISTDDGIYTFNALPAAHYRITAQRDGFKQKVLDDVTIIPEQLNALDLQLEVGDVQQTVTVSGSIQTLDTETATVSSTLSARQVQNLPSFGRDVFQLIQLTPGVIGDGAQGGGGAGQNLPGSQGPGATGGKDGIFRTENGPQALAGGQQYENNGISLDGISTASAVWGGTTIITPSEDSVDNVKVVSNSYDSENGRFSGAQIQVTSKAGTNQFHGGAFFTRHTPGLNAFQPFNGNGNKVLRDENQFNQFGANLGGPIWKNKIFAFFNYETVRNPNSRSIANQWYETPAFEGLAPAGSIAATYLSFPGNSPVTSAINPSTCADAGLNEGVNCATIPGQGLDIGSPLTTPLGTHDLSWQSVTNPGVGSGLDGIADIANFVTAGQATSDSAQYNGRLDFNLRDSDRLAFAIYYVPQSSTFLNGPARGYNFFHHSQVNEAYSVIWNHTFSPTMVNEFRVNAAGWRWNEITSNPQQPVGLPQDNIDQIGNLGQSGNNPIQHFGASIGSILKQWTYTFKDVATKVHGRHTIKFGGEITRLFYLNECTGCGVPGYNFFNVWDFLNDAPHVEGPTGFNPNTGIPTTQRQDDRENIWGLFVQDDLKVRRNLTLNLGLRWSYFGPLYAKQNNMFASFPGSGADFLTGLNVKKANSWDPEKNNFGPQIGFAWNPDRWGNKVVLRGGYGLNYNQEQISISANVQGNPGLIVFPTFTQSTPTSPNPGIVYSTAGDLHDLNSYPSNPNAIVQFGPNGLPTTGQVNVSIFPRNLPTMRVHHYSADAQIDLGHNLMATIGYQGSLSRNIFYHSNPNATTASQGFQLNPQIGGGDLWGVNGWGNFNAMVATLRHNFSHQFMADAQFMWAKSMDTSSGPYWEQYYPYDLNLSYGRSDYNIDKSFKLYGLWQPVFFHGDHGWMEKVLGGWSLSGVFNIHSGFPWSPVASVTGGSLYCGNCSYTTLLPANVQGAFGTSTSNDAFKTGSNFPQGGSVFVPPTFTAFSNPTDFGNENPQTPLVKRNSLNGPGYKDVDITVVKAFGLPNNKVLGEGAKIEFRMDAYNVFNNLNFRNSNPGDISNNISNANFGQATVALAGRVVTLGARFAF